MNCGARAQTRLGSAHFQSGPISPMALGSFHEAREAAREALGVACCSLSLCYTFDLPTPPLSPCVLTTPTLLCRNCSRWPLLPILCDCHLRQRSSPLSYLTPTCYACFHGEHECLICSHLGAARYGGSSAVMFNELPKSSWLKHTHTFHGQDTTALGLHILSAELRGPIGLSPSHIGSA